MNNTIAWLAGIVDGEGTITITRQKREDYKKHPYSYRPEIHITNTSILMLEEVLRILRETISKETKIFSSSNRNPRTVYRVRIQDRKSCLALIKLLLPHLIAKKSQAKLLKDFLQSNGSNSETQAFRIREMNAGK